MARILIGNIRGPQGPSGPAGSIGPKGDKGDPGQGATLINSLVQSTAGVGALDAYQGKVLSDRISGFSEKYPASVNENITAGQTISYKLEKNVSAILFAFRSGFFAVYAIGYGENAAVKIAGTDDVVEITKASNSLNFAVKNLKSIATHVNIFGAEKV